MKNLVDWLTFISSSIVRGIEWDFNSCAVRGEGQNRTIETHLLVYDMHKGCL